MAMLTLEEAARLSGKSKSTLARAIKAGRLSANRTDLGTYEIDQAELARAYPFPALTEAAGATGTVTDDTPEATLRVAVAEQRLSDARAQIEELRADRDAWRETAQKLLLTDTRSRRSLWARLTGR
jgi:hypothetical protein